MYKYCTTSEKGDGKRRFFAILVKIAASRVNLKASLNCNSTLADIFGLLCQLSISHIKSARAVLNFRMPKMATRGRFSKFFDKRLEKIYVDGNIFYFMKISQKCTIEEIFNKCLLAPPTQVTLWPADSLQVKSANPDGDNYFLKVTFYLWSHLIAVSFLTSSNNGRSQTEFQRRTRTTILPS